MTIVHESLDKPSFVTDVVYTQVLCRPKPNPMTFESVIVNNLFKPIDKLHPPVPRRFTRL